MMVAEEYLSRSRLFRHLKSGLHGQLVELYAVRLVKDGLAHHERARVNRFSAVDAVPCAKLADLRDLARRGDGQFQF